MDLMTSSAAQEAFQIDKETTEVSRKIRANRPRPVALLSRRLVEAGVNFVTINDRGMGQLGWDTHAQNFPTLKTAGSVA